MLEALIFTIIFGAIGIFAYLAIDTMLRDRKNDLKRHRRIRE